MRHFLFLQGLRSPFFNQLALTLAQHPCRVTKLHFSAGDHLHWSGPARRCRVTEAQLPRFYRELFDETAASDLVLFGDCRGIHRPAIELARQRDLTVHVFEEGYFRPDWITLERDGVNGHSPLPADPSWYREAAKVLGAHEPSAPTTVGPAMGARVWHDIRYNAASAFDPIFYPNYRSHTPHSIASEYAAYVRRTASLPWQKPADQRVMAELMATPQTPYFLVALQVRGDSQLTHHSDYPDSAPFVRRVMTSFLRFAPDHSLLVFKNHPLDPGLKRHDKMVNQIAGELGCSARVRFLDSGHLPTLLDHAQGLVAINSTAIGQALFHRCPTIALGKSIFALPGLTFTDGLDAFWGAASRPDMRLFDAFRRVVIHTTQINGGLYSRRGIELAVPEAVKRLLEPTSRLQALLDTHGAAASSTHNLTTRPGS